MNRITVVVFLLLLLPTGPISAQQHGWTVVARPDPRYYLTALCFVDSLHGWCAGALTIYRTTDGGITWKGGVQPYTPNDFFSLSFIDTLLGWAAGTLDNASATIWHTTDGGLSWVDETGYLPRRLYLSTSALSANTILSVGRTVDFHPDTGKILQTVNGGGTWDEKTLADSLESWEHIQFVDSLHGWISGASLTGVFGLARTSNSGVSWQVVRLPNYIQFFCFLDSLLGWGSGGSRVYRSSDGGLSWQLLASVIDTLWGQASINCLSFQDSLNGRAFGTIAYYGILTEGIFRTTDGGRSWLRESIALTGDFGGVNDAQMLDAEQGWAVCNDGSVLKYGVLTSVGEPLPELLPRHHALHQNYPNPFNPTTTIEYETASANRVRLVIYDLLGNAVRVLVDERQAPGLHRVRLEASGLAAGVYYYQLSVGDFVETKEMLLIK